MLNFSRILSARELLNEKKKDFRNVVMLQATIVISGLMLSGLLVPGNITSSSKAVTLLMSGFGAFYSYLLWDLLRDFTSKVWLIRLIFFVITAVVISGVITEFPYYHLFQVPDRRLYLLTLHSILFLVEITVISYSIIDVFSGKVLTPDKLWGAACVYLMIAISFASLYDILNFIQPGCFGISLELGLPSYSECIYHSFAVLGGGDSQYVQPIRMVRNVGVIESVWGNLFAMLIIGKLLSLPLQEQEEIGRG